MGGCQLLKRAGYPFLWDWPHTLVHSLELLDHSTALSLICLAMLAKEAVYGGSEVQIPF
jgi:hypothetical protein